MACNAAYAWLQSASLAPNDFSLAANCLSFGTTRSHADPGGPCPWLADIEIPYSIAREPGALCSLFPLAEWEYFHLDTEYAASAFYIRALLSIIPDEIRRKVFLDVLVGLVGADHSGPRGTRVRGAVPTVISDQSGPAKKRKDPEVQISQSLNLPLGDLYGRALYSYDHRFRKTMVWGSGEKLFTPVRASA